MAHSKSQPVDPVLEVSLFLHLPTVEVGALPRELATPPGFPGPPGISLHGGILPAKVSFCLSLLSTLTADQRHRVTGERKRGPRRFHFEEIGHNLSCQVKNRYELFSS